MSDEELTPEVLARREYHVKMPWLVFALEGNILLKRRRSYLINLLLVKLKQ